MINRKQTSGLIFFVVSLCILIISCLPGSNIPSGTASFASMDLITHFLMYGFLSHVFYRFLKDLLYPNHIGSVSLILVVLVPFVYGVVLELLQNFVPGRQSSIEDALYALNNTEMDYVVIEDYLFGKLK